MSGATDWFVSVQVAKLFLDFHFFHILYHDDWIRRCIRIACKSKPQPCRGVTNLAAGDSTNFIQINLEQ